MHGCTAAALDHLLRRGQLEAVYMGVYRVPGSKVSAHQRLCAAVLRAGRGARITGWSAAGLYGLEGMEIDCKPWVVIPPERRVRDDGLVVQRSPLSRGDAAAVAGVPSVTPVRALLDAAMRVRGTSLRVAIDDARRRGLVDLNRLLHRAAELGRHPGAAQVRRMFGSGLLDQDGELERGLALALAEVGLRPVWGMEVLPGVIADACFPEASYVLECDGRHWHTIDTDRASDLSRESLLRADGWAVDRVRSTDLRNRRSELIQRIRTTRRQRMDAGSGRPAAWRPVRPGRRIRPPRARRTA